MSKMQVAKVTLSTKKVVYLRKLKIKDTETAIQTASQRVPENAHAQVMNVAMQADLLKLLLVQVGDSKLSNSQKEDLDSLFEPLEYAQLLKTVGKMAGVEEMGKEPELEFVNET